MKTRLVVKSSRAQMKVQQMAFLLVAITIFFAMIALVYFSITSANIRNTAIALQDEEAKTLVRKLASSPELAFTAASDCASCIDVDKAIQIANTNNYRDLWNLDHLFIELLLPENTTAQECTSQNYPDCNKIIILSKSDQIATKTAFVTLARWDNSKEVYKYEFGRLHASPQRQNEK